MNYSEVKEYMLNTSKLGIVPGLDTIKELLKRCGNPQKHLTIINVVGTNGKGSVSRYISNIVMKAGYVVGTYSSPSVFDELEIISINGKYISTDEYASIISMIAKNIEDMVAEGMPHATSFEIETVAMYIYFWRMNCKLCVIEAGMGGLEDATNVCDSNLCTVITSISLDHMKFLGDTIEKIAANKAGMIKRDCPTVLYNQSDEVIKTIKDVANSKASRLVITKNITNINEAGSFTYNEMEYTLTMRGMYQPRNAAVAIEVVNILKEAGFIISDGDIKDALFSMQLKGRFEILRKNPYVIRDGAHNPDAVARLKESLNIYFKNREFIFIIGVLADKAYDNEMRTIASQAKKIYTVTPKNKRALDGRELKKCIEKYNSNVEYAISAKKALKEALKEANTQDVIVAFGSLSYIKEIEI